MMDTDPKIRVQGVPMPCLAATRFPLAATLAITIVSPLPVVGQPTPATVSNLRSVGAMISADETSRPIFQPGAGTQDLRGAESE